MKFYARSLFAMTLSVIATTALAQAQNASGVKKVASVFELEGKSYTVSLEAYQQRSQAVAFCQKLGAYQLAESADILHLADIGAAEEESDLANAVLFDLSTSFGKTGVIGWIGAQEISALAHQNVDIYTRDDGGLTSVEYANLATVNQGFKKAMPISFSELSIRAVCVKKPVQRK